MKAVCICTSNRPEVLRRCLASLSKNKTEGWTLIVSRDMDSPSVLAEIEKVKFMPVTHWLNPARLGPDLNTFTVCSVSMEGFGADAQLYLDDDMMLSPDALDLCNWFLSRKDLQDPSRSAGLCICTKDNNPTRANSIATNDGWMGLVGQGYCYTREMWFQFIKRVWWVYEPHFGGDAYDWAIGHKAKDTGRKIYRPRFSRSMHMGGMGHHGRGEQFPAHISDGERRDYVLEER